MGVCKVSAGAFAAGWNTASLSLLFPVSVRAVLTFKKKLSKNKPNVQTSMHMAIQYRPVTNSNQSQTVPEKQTQLNPISVGMHVCVFQTGCYLGLCSRLIPLCSWQRAVYLQVSSQLLKLSLTRLSSAQREPAVGLSGCPTMLPPSREAGSRTGGMGLCEVWWASGYDGTFRWYLLPWKTRQNYSGKLLGKRNAVERLTMTSLNDSSSQNHFHIIELFY